MKQERKNILLIHADQHRIDCLGAYGNKDIKTPNLDALAEEGITYNNSFCAYPVCTPSRYSLLTGLQVREHGSWSNHCTLPTYIETFPKVLRRSGFRTAAVGKMHFTPTYLDVGFDKMVLCEQDGPGRFDDDYHRDLMVNDLCDSNDLEDQRAEYRKDASSDYWASLGAVVSNLPNDWHSTSWIGQKALEEIEDWEETGNLLMVGFVKPHHPFDPSEEWRNLYKSDDLSLLPGWIETCLAKDLAYDEGYFPHQENNEAKVRKAMAYYYANISHIDDEVGKMIALLKKKGQYDNTVIIYTSDHGDYMGYHHLMLKGGYMYEPLMKVPLIIKDTNGENQGYRSEQLVSNVDIASTLLHLMDVDIPLSMKDYNLMKDKRAYVFGECGYKQDYMLRDERYKLLLCKDHSKSQFFDLKHDPLEMDNRYKDTAYEKVITTMKAKLMDLVLFDLAIPLCVDEEAEIVNTENAVGYDKKRRAVVEAYYKEKMSKLMMWNNLEETEN